MSSHHDDFSFSDVGNRKFHKLITTKLIEFNRAKSSELTQWYKPNNDSPISLEIYSLVEPQLVVGGLIGYVHWGWLEIDIVWVDEPYRGKGIGKQLVDYAEQKALDRGAKRAKLNTLCSFDVPVHLASIADPADNFARCTYPGCPCWVNCSDSNCNSNNLSE